MLRVAARRHGPTIATKCRVRVGVALWSTVGANSAVLGEDLKVQRTFGVGGMRDYFDKSINLGPVFGVVASIDAGDQYQPLSIEAEAVSRRELNVPRAIGWVLRPRLLAPMNL